MGRPLWFVAGAGAGMYAAVRARRAAEAFTPDGLRDRLRGWQVGARMFAEEVQTHRAERETELRENLGLAPQLGRGFEARSARTSTTEVSARTSTTEVSARTSTTELPEVPARTATETKDQP